MDIGRNRLWLQSFKYSKCLGRCVIDDPTIGTLIHMLFQVLAHARVEGFVQVLVKFPEELLTGKQKRRPPCAETGASASPEAAILREAICSLLLK